MVREKIDIAVCLDKGFVMPTGVMMYSVCVNNPDVDIVFHVVVNESVNDSDKNDLVEVLSEFQNKMCIFYLVSSQLTASFPINDCFHITRMTYCRLFLTEILPPNIDKVLYLDGDIIVRHSLRPLWNINLENQAVGVAIEWSEGYNEIYKRLEYSSHKGYFNAGVLLINLSYWRKYSVVNDFVDYIKNYPEKIRCEDQDVLNVVFQDKKCSIPVKYNLQTGFLGKVPSWDYRKYENEVKEGLKDPVIVHFTEGNKPWFVDTCPQHPFRNTFYKYQNQTKWKGVLLEHCSLYKKIKKKLGKTLRKLMHMVPMSSPYKEIPPID